MVLERGGECAASAGWRARSGAGPGWRATRSATRRSSPPAHHGTTLHWWRNDGTISDGQLLLADMGIETDELYTADVTRTMPVTGELDAQPAQGLPTPSWRPRTPASPRSGPAPISWPPTARRCGCWPTTCTRGASCRSAPTSRARPTSEAPGCRSAPALHAARHVAHARHRRARLRGRPARRSTPRARWPRGTYSPSSPACTSSPTTRVVPADLRGLAVRIEDDILVTDGGAVNLSAAPCPATPPSVDGMDARGSGRHRPTI